MWGRKKVKLLESETFASELDREHLLAYFMGCAISGLCARGYIAGKLADEAKSIAEAAVNSYYRNEGPPDLETDRKG